MIYFNTGVASDINTNKNTKGGNNMNNYNRLYNKMNKRIGKKAVANDDMIFGIISDIYIETIDEGTREERNTVNYSIDYGDYKRLVNENLVTIMK